LLVPFFSVVMFLSRIWLCEWHHVVFLLSKRKRKTSRVSYHVTECYLRHYFVALWCCICFPNSHNVQSMGLTILFYTGHVKEYCFLVYLAPGRLCLLKLLQQRQVLILSTYQCQALLQRYLNNTMLIRFDHIFQCLLAALNFSILWVVWWGRKVCESCVLTCKQKLRRQQVLHVTWTPKFYPQQRAGTPLLHEKYDKSISTDLIRFKRPSLREIEGINIFFYDFLQLTWEFLIIDNEHGTNPSWELKLDFFFLTQR
jgi:hypothetical protein